MWHKPLLAIAGPWVFLLVVSSAAAQEVLLPSAPSPAVAAAGAPLLLPPSAAEVWQCPRLKLSHPMSPIKKFSTFRQGFYTLIKMPANAFGIDQMAWGPWEPCLNTYLEALKACIGYFGRLIWLPAPAEAVGLHQGATARVQELTVQDCAAAGWLRPCCELQEGQGQGAVSWLRLCD